MLSKKNEHLQKKFKHSQINSYRMENIQVIIINVKLNTYNINISLFYYNLINMIKEEKLFESINTKFCDTE